MQIGCWARLISNTFADCRVPALGVFISTIPGKLKADFALVSSGRGTPSATGCQSFQRRPYLSPPVSLVLVHKATPDPEPLFLNGRTSNLLLGLLDQLPCLYCALQLAWHCMHLYPEGQAQTGKVGKERPQLPPEHSAIGHTSSGEAAGPHRIICFFPGTFVKSLK
jgi:hypothetical protein